MAVPTPRPRLLLLGQNLLLAAGTVIVVGGGAEAVARLRERGQGAPPPVAEYINDWGGTEFVTLQSAARGWPPWEDYNSDGVRDREHEVARTPGVRRVACLGDSVTLGYGIRPQDAWPQVLEDLLESHGERVEVFNVAFGGWSTRQELIAYRRLARKYRPDQVLLGICLNDIPEMQNNLTRPPRFVRALYRRSALVRAVVGARRREISSVEELFDEPSSPRVRDAYRLMFDDLRALNVEVGADGARLAVVVLPFRFQVLPGAPAPAAQQEIERFCAGERIAFLDVLAPLRPVGEAAFIDYDHFSPAGARRVAEAIADSGLLEHARGPEGVAAAPATVAATPAQPLGDLLVMLHAADAGQRAAAARALGNRGSEPASVVPALASALVDPVPEVRAGAAWGLGGFRSDAAPALRALQAALDDGSPAVRAGAAWALAQIGPAARPATAALVSRLVDDDESVRWRAGHALSTIGPEPSRDLEPLRRMAADAACRGRAEAAAALGAMGPAAAAAVPALAFALSDPRHDVRARSAWALGRIGTASAAAVPALVAMTRDPVDGWRAIDALGEIGPPAAAAQAALTEALAQPSGSVRWRAAQALGRLGDAARPSGPALARALQDGEENVRLAAARALALAGVDAAVSRAPLISALSDSDSRVRVAAVRALHRLEPDEVTTQAIAERARSDPDEAVRAAARHALKPGRS